MDQYFNMAQGSSYHFGPTDTYIDRRAPFAPTIKLNYKDSNATGPNFGTQKKPGPEVRTCGGQKTI
jgi:hypothetical protein